MYYLPRNPEGEPMVPAYPLGLVLDVDDTIIDPYAQDEDGPYDGHLLHGISRIRVAHAIGSELGNAFLATLSPADSQHSFETAEEHTTAGSIANLLHMAGILEAPAVDLQNPILQDFIEKRQLEHLGVIGKWASLSEGAIPLLEFGLTTEFGQSIATAGSQEEFDVVYGTFNLQRYVRKEHAWTADTVFNVKPYYGHYLSAAKSLIPKYIDGHDEHEIIKKMWAIDDSPHGLQSAHDAGLVTVGYASRMAVGELLDLEQVDAVVDSLESVPELARDIRRRERQLERRHVLAQKMEEASARMH